MNIDRDQGQGIDRTGNARRRRRALPQRQGERHPVVGAAHVRRRTSAGDPTPWFPRRVARPSPRPRRGQPPPDRRGRDPVLEKRRDADVRPGRRDRTRAQPPAMAKQGACGRLVGHPRAPRAANARQNPGRPGRPTGLLAVLTPIGTEKPETARRVWRRIRAVLKAAPTHRVPSSRAGSRLGLRVHDGTAFRYRPGEPMPRSCPGSS